MGYYLLIRTVFFLQLTLISMIVCQDFRYDPSNDVHQKFAPSRFDIFWNIPTFQCDSHKLNFTDLAAKYGIIQNPNDRFQGNEIAILYDPGSFPAILKTADGSGIILRNGGVPQEGNLTVHLELFQEIVDGLIPNENFSGVAVIDFESWRPIYRQNFGSLEPYKHLSVKIEKQYHPFWPRSLLEKEAATRFEFYGRMFVEETLIFAKQLRPMGRWGYYAYPYCFNMSPLNMRTQCPNEVLKENDRMEWLFNISDNLHPSIYLRETRLTLEEKMQLIEGRINEAHRIIGYIHKSGNVPKVLPYFWYKYQDTGKFLSKDDLHNALFAIKTNEADGFILWGSSNDVNTKAKCLALYEYIDTVLGPIIISRK